MNDILFRIRNLEFSYERERFSKNTEPVLKIDQLNLQKGKIITFRGLNGSGKTTLLRILSGLLLPEKGLIEDFCDQRPILVHQEPYLFHGTVYQNLVYALRFHSSSRLNRNERIEEVLDFVGLKGFEKRKARELSGGETKRVAIARALVTNPSILLLDEPDANVDRTTSLELEQLLLLMSRQGMSIILCTHNNRLAYRISDEILDLYRGKTLDHHENIFRGTYEYREEMYSIFSWGECRLKSPSRHGDYASAVISSKDIFLSKDRIDKEDYNQLSGKIVSIYPFKEDRYIVTLDCGITIKSQISGTALEQLDGKKGDEVFAIFNPSAVHLY